MNTKKIKIKSKSQIETKTKNIPIISKSTSPKLNLTQRNTKKKNKISNNLPLKKITKSPTGLKVRNPSRLKTRLTTESLANTAENTKGGNKSNKSKLIIKRITSQKKTQNMSNIQSPKKLEEKKNKKFGRDELKEKEKERIKNKERGNKISVKEFINKSDAECIKNNKKYKNDEIIGKVSTNYNNIVGLLNKELETVGILEEKKEDELLTPFPEINKEKNGEKSSAAVLFHKAMKNVNLLRRLEYDNYIDEIIKKNVKYKEKYKKLYDITNISSTAKKIGSTSGRSEKRSEKAKIPDIKYITKVIEIQKIFKGFVSRNIDQKLNKLKVRNCFIEIFSLLVNHYFFKYKIKESFNKIKTHYSSPFTNINNELTFADKLSIKLIDSYYQRINFGFKKFQNNSKNE